ncbi:MAG: nucleotide exchange factor GrpE [Terriglobales bacterium]
MSDDMSDDMSSEDQEFNPALDPDHELAASEPESELAQEARKLREERDTLQDRLLRALAEADNARKRFGRDMQEARQHATVEAVRPFLAVLDSFDRAAAHAAASSIEELRKAMDLLHRQLLDAVRKAGLEPVAARGQAFDPHWHEALELVESDEAPEGSVVEELQRGYKLHEHLVRPAMVKVARRKP